MSGNTPAPAVALPVRLVVTKPFGDYAAGAEITDEADIKEIWEGGQRSHVVATAALPEAKEPELPTEDHGAPVEHAESDHADAAHVETER